MQAIVLLNSKFKLFVLIVFVSTWILAAKNAHVRAKMVYRCPSICVCDLHPEKPNRVRVDCTSKNLTSIPTNIDMKTIKLDLSLNQITHLQERAFPELIHLESLYLQGNQLQSLPTDALSGLSQLELLYLDRNNVSIVPENSFKELRNLKKLRLDSNKLTSIPVAALNQAVRLDALDLENNLIETIPDYAFTNLRNLAVLVLSNNRIKHIGERAFYGLSVLSLLELSKNRLKEIPVALHALPDLFDLTVAENQIEELPDDCFAGNRKLSILKLKDNPIRKVGRNAFNNMPYLEELALSEVSEMTEFPNIIGTVNLKQIILDRSSISVLPENVCQNMNRLTVFDVHTNRISWIPKMSDCSSLTLLNLGNNDISCIENNTLEGLRNLKDLILAYNRITYISDKAFAGLHKLQYLDLSFNKITYIHPDAFCNLLSLEDLNLSENQFEHLPTRGLSNLRHLKTYHNRELQEPPPFEALPNILTMVVAYSYHCCAFVRDTKHAGSPEGAFTFDEKITWLEGANISAFWSSAIANNVTYGDSMFGALYPDYSTNLTIDGDIIDPNTHGPDDDYQSAIFNVETMIRIKPPVECSPLPNPFQPCDDLFGWWSLRCGVWVVFLLAVIGNTTVLFVSLTSKTKMDVTRFLICNLAFADLCMGIYLGFLAIVDASTLGHFEKYAVRWQTSLWCLVAGFLGVLSSELSVFTLVVITLERFYAISHALELGRRVRMGHAYVMMTFGWLFCVAIACLPLFKISDYRKFAICLPFEAETELSRAYVCFIMIFNAISFIVILICYAGMFVSIRAAHSWSSNDTVVAKRMALLVFTDFFCWAPIVFFSVAAAFEWNFAKIGLDDAKVLTIFVLPLNSCANPFLYAFFTRQFKRDCVKLCKRIEEFNITRHLSSSAVIRSSTVNRHAPVNVVHIKRSSCDRLVNEAGTSRETSNNGSDDSDLAIKNIQLTVEEQNILRYVRTDRGLDSVSSMSSRNPLSQSLFDSQELEELNLVPIKTAISRKRVSLPRKLKKDERGSGPDIILHTNEGNVYINSASNFHKSVLSKTGHRNRNVPVEVSSKCAERLCHHTIPNTVIPLTISNISVKSQAVETVEKPGGQHAPNTEHKETMLESAFKLNRLESAHKKFITERGKELGLQIQYFGQSSKLPLKTECCNQIYASTQMDIIINQELQHNLAADLAKREKDWHINEWRKSSHQSFLWSNSGSFDVVTQKQKSYSLVELSRPLGSLHQHVPCGKRYSLTSKQEGYILLKSSSRDSAYEDDEFFVFYDGRCVTLNGDKSDSEISNQLTDIDNINFIVQRQIGNTHVNVKDGDVRDNPVERIVGDTPTDDSSGVDSINKLCETSFLLTNNIGENTCLFF